MYCLIDFCIKHDLKFNMMYDPMLDSMKFMFETRDHKATDISVSITEYLAAKNNIFNIEQFLIMKAEELLNKEVQLSNDRYL